MPGWQLVGRVPISREKPMTIRVEGASFESGSIQGNYSTGKLARKAPQSSQVPALLVISNYTGAADFAEMFGDFTDTLDVVRGNLESAAPVDDPRRAHVRTNHEGARFQPPESAEAWQSRRQAMRRRLLVTLGLWPMPSKTPLNPQVYGKVDRDGYTIEKVTLETLPGYILAGNLYRPKGNTAKVPAMLCPHGHWDDGRVNENVQERCIRFARLGCVVFMYEMVGYNDSKPFGHAFLDKKLDLWGYSLPTLQTWNSLRTLDWITTLPDVDPARIGITGESGGGTQTFLLTALDPRIAVSAPVVMVSERFQGGCACENCSGLRIGTDNVEIAAMAAPRPMMMVGASGDWTSNTITKVHPMIRGVYERLGVPSLVEARQFDFPHNYNKTSREAVYAFMGEKLLGIQDAASTKEGTQTPEKGEDLLVYDEKHPAPSGLKTAAQLEDELIGVRVRQLEKLAPGEDSTAWDASKNGLLTALKIRVGLTNPIASNLKATEVRRTVKGGTTIVHSILKRTDTGDAIPVVRLTPSKENGRVVVLFDLGGKSGLISPVVESLLARGVTVIGFDPLFVGESFDPAHPAAKKARHGAFFDVQSLARGRSHAGPGHGGCLGKVDRRNPRSQPDRKGSGRRLDVAGASGAGWGLQNGRRAGGV